MQGSRNRGRWMVMALCASVLLVACNNDTGSSELPNDDHNHDHDHGTAESAGRLIVTSADGSNSRVHVYDLSNQSVIGDYALTYPASAVYASPGHRYALVVQRENDQVEVLDSGLHQHDTHFHADDPSMLGFILSGVRPTHYRVNADQAALFYDGNADNGNLAQFELLTDASLAAGGVVASQTLASAHHGIAEPLGDLMLVSNASGGSVDGVVTYELYGDHFHAAATLSTACPGLHGGASNETYSVFGCQDGVLLAELHGDHFHDSKVTVDERIATVLGHQALDHFAAFAYPSGNLYEIDPASGSAAAVDWRNGSANGEGKPAQAVEYGIDPHGEHLLIIDETGTLHVLSTTDWAREGTIDLPTDGSSTDITPALAFSASTAVAFVSDPATQSIHTIDLEALSLVDDPIQLDFAPVGLAWTGIAAAKSGSHDHAHDDEEDHEHDH